MQWPMKLKREHGHLDNPATVKPACPDFTVNIGLLWDGSGSSLHIFSPEPAAVARTTGRLHTDARDQHLDN
jgi:hypothetical protein